MGSPGGLKVIIEAQKWPCWSKGRVRAALFCRVLSDLMFGTVFHRFWHPFRPPDPYETLRIAVFRQVFNFRTELPRCLRKGSKRPSKRTQNDDQSTQSGQESPRSDFGSRGAREAPDIFPGRRPKQNARTPGGSFWGAPGGGSNPGLHLAAGRPAGARHGGGPGALARRRK